MNLIDASPQIYFGDSSLEFLKKLPKEMVVIITDPFMVESGIIKIITNIFDSAGCPYSVFSQVEPDPSIATIVAGMQLILNKKPEIVLALGGGSAIDACKGMLYFCVKYKSALMGSKYVHKPMFIAVPTTSGTGSEVTSYTVITDHENNVKIPISDKCMIPDVAILYPEFTRTLPKPMVAYTGMDVLSHGLEAYVTKGANSFTDMYAITASKTVFQSLPLLFAADPPTALYEEMMIASTIAGLAFSNSGLGLCHGIAHTIGAEYHVPHGKANSIILPYVIAFNAGVGHYKDDSNADVRKKYAELARALGFSGNSDDTLVGELILKISGLNSIFGTPSSLNHEGIDRTMFFSRMDIAASKIMEDVCTSANPIEVTKNDVIKLLTDIYNGVTLI